MRPDPKERKNPKRDRFVDEYCKDFNGAQAAVRSGYSPNCARQTATRLLSNADIQAKIAARRVEQSRSALLSAQDVLNEIDAVASASMDEIFDFSGTGVLPLPAHQISARARRAIKRLDVKVLRNREGQPIGELVSVQMYDKVQALRLASEHRGLLDFDAELLDDMTETELARVSAGEHPLRVRASRTLEA